MPAGAVPEVTPGTKVHDGAVRVALTGNLDVPGTRAPRIAALRSDAALGVLSGSFRAAGGRSCRGCGTDGTRGTACSTEGCRTWAGLGAGLGRFGSGAPFACLAAARLIRASRDRTETKASGGARGPAATAGCWVGCLPCGCGSTVGAGGTVSGGAVEGLRGRAPGPAVQVRSSSGTPVHATGGGLGVGCGVR